MPSKSFLRYTRRHVIQGIVVSVAVGAAAKLSGRRAQAADQLKIGFIYVGPKDDFGYNQAHAEGAATIGASDSVEIVEEANVPETAAVQESMRSMIELDGISVLFPTSFGYFDPHILTLAAEFPEVQFFHCGGLYQEGVTPENVGSYFGYIDEAQYIAGIVAGHMTGSGKLGFIAAKPIPQVLRNINSFTLAARSVNPAITTQVIFTGDWALPVKEAEAANSMADQGIDIITCHVDSPKVVMETAERRGIYCSGYHANQAPLAPKGYLTGAEWDWSNIYTNYVTMLAEGKTLMNGGIPHLVRGGLKESFCKISAYGSAVSDAAKAAADTTVEAFLSDASLTIYQGELKDNEGNVVIPSGTALAQQDPTLEQMNYLVEGVVGSLS
ncbi:MAG: BMP family ABC transporter substrate-binding protein [Synechococcaceae cyanobacterium SM2_3_1]|nr:BMP family ABC transporter substrate-binding protein [Synechococcaceae cyanobacterium SM2_3_1]